MTVRRSSTTVLFLTVLYSSIAESKLEYDGSPTLPELQHFPVKDNFKDIVAEIQNDYEQFGTLLLEDSNGVKVKGIAMAKLGDPVAITVEILREWLKGRGRTPVTWRTFVKCLHESRLNVLADDIEAELGGSKHPPQQQQPTSDSRFPETSADVGLPPVWIISSVGLIIGGVGGILVIVVMVVIMKRDKVKDDRFPSPAAAAAAAAAAAGGQANQGSPEPGNIIHRGDKPVLRKLLKFPGKYEKINIPERIGTNYKTFGTFLLNDDSGTIISGIERAKMHDADEINKAILEKWIGGKGRGPFTWDTLVECLRDTELNVLASEIKEVLQ